MLLQCTKTMQNKLKINDGEMCIRDRAEGMENVEAFLSKAKEAFGTDMSFKIIQLPAVLTCHAGLGSFAVQSCLKN